MTCLRMLTAPTGAKLPVGSSKFLGNPDVWTDFSWPFTVADGEEYDLTFMCQINCADIATYDLDGLLPHRGMLYFFYDLDEMPWSPENPQNARVLYYDGDLSALRELMVVDGEGEPVAPTAQAITFQPVEEGFLADDEPTHLLLGEPSLDYGTTYPCIEGWQMLLQIDSFETEEIAVNFTDEGVLCFYIHPEKLKARDFSDVRIMQIYS